MFDPWLTPLTLIFKFHIIIIWFISLISFHYSLTFVFDFHFLKFHPCLSSLTGCHPWFSFLTFILKLVLHYSSTLIFDSLTFILNIYFLFLIAFILQTINPCSEQPTGPLIINKLLYLINLIPLIPLSDCNLITNNVSPWVREAFKNKTKSLKSREIKGC